MYHCFCCFKQIRLYILSGSFPLVFGISLADVKNFLLKSLFFQNWHFFICVIFLLRATWVLFLKQKLVYCILSFCLICADNCKEHADIFVIPVTFFRARGEFVLSMQILQPLTKYLRLTLVSIWNSALREKFKFCFSTGFC